MKNRHKSLRYLYLSEALNKKSDDVVFLPEDKVRHFRKVLRMEWGESVYILNGHGERFESVLSQIDGKACVVLGESKTSIFNPPEIELVIGMPKNSIMDFIVEKATELGVKKITPIQTSRSVVQVDASELSKYKRRWLSIVEEAVAQTESFWVPEITDPQTWKEWLSKSKFSKVHPGFLFSSELRSSGLSSDLMQSSWKELRINKGSTMSLVVGPEGGFSEEELEQAKGIGAHFLSLGSQVLRVETAVISALTVAKWSQVVY